MKVYDLYAFLQELAPLSLQMEFDNAGFLIGHEEQDVHRVLLSLDVTPAVIEEAVSQNIDLIITHHPVIFRPVKALTDSKPNSAMLLRLIENHISVISMHTNLDAAEGGVNDALISRFSCKKIGILDEKTGLGRIGEFEEEIPLSLFLATCRKVLCANGLRYISSAQKVKRVAFMGGAGADFIMEAVAMGCDTMVTGDVKYHEFLTAAENGLTLIDADHYCTENPIISVLFDKLSAVITDDVELRVSSVHKQPVQFYPFTEV